MFRPNKIDDEDSVAWPKVKCGMRVFILFKKKKGKCGIFQILFYLNENVCGKINKSFFDHKCSICILV